MKKTDSTLVLESSSNNTRFLGFKIWAVAAVFTAAHILFLSPAEAYTVRVVGLAPWQSVIAERSMNAVAKRLPSNQQGRATEKVMKVVADKLFTGYVVESVKASSGDITMMLAPNEKIPEWDVDIALPNVQAPPLDWFKSDADKVKEPLSALVKNLPVSALSWCDNGLCEEMLKTLKPVLPGWTPSIMVREVDGKTVMRVSFTPEMPLVIAISPQFESNTLPSLLYNELKEDMIVQMSPFIGLPVSWAAAHTKDVNKWVQDYLSQRTLTERASATPKASFSAGQVSHLNVDVESNHYYVSAWAAVYAGTSERSAELGVHLGRIFELLPHWDMEIYGEGIIGLRDWNTEGRLGARWSPWGDVWLGGEWSSKDNMWWGRINIEPRLHKPYVWLRVREDGEVNAALGWKATKYISLEAHYDSRDNDVWSLRMIGNM